MTGAGRVVFRCDAGAGIGIGHVMRCLALAEEFAERHWTVGFVADLADLPWAREQVESRGFTLVPPPDDVSGEVEALAGLQPDWLVLDSYLLPGHLGADLQARGLRVLTFVDGDPTDRTGTVLLDQNIGAEGDSWPTVGSPHRLAGLGYALMRSDIRAQRPAVVREQSSTPPRVFAFFGGTDAFGAGPDVARALIATGEPFDLRVVAPRPWTDAGITPHAGQSMTVIGPTDRLAAEVNTADLVISAAGTSSWELLCLAAACAFVCVADNQVLGYQRAIDAGLGFGLGSLDDLRDDPSSATATLASALRSPERLAWLRRAGWSTVDGDGRKRVVDALLALPK